KTFFDLRPKVRKESVSKGFYSNCFVPRTFQEGIRAALRFLSSHRIGTKHQPVKFDALCPLNHPQQRATAADLDVVAMRSHAKHALHAIQIARNHSLISC